MEILGGAVTLRGEEIWDFGGEGRGRGWGGGRCGLIGGFVGGGWRYLPFGCWRLAALVASAPGNGLGYPVLPSLW
ncbi:hypothetical protein LIA77_09167 [Sarocladium implicatum]|nr:hypothetical protein LIA77_09167 [Sarocladium implicatum]